MGLRDELTEMKVILKKLDSQKEAKKKFKIPFFSKVKGVKAKKNYVTLMKIQENGHISFKIVQIDDQTIVEDGIPRLAAAGYVLFYKKNPIIILPSWSVEPFSSLKHYKESLFEGTNTAGYRLLLSKMKSSSVDFKKPMMGGMLKWIIGIGLAAIVGYALMTGGGS